MWVVVEAERLVIIRIFDDYLRHGNMSQIAKDLNAEGIPTASGKVGAWRRGTVRKIIDRPEYAGMVRVDGEIVSEDAKHPAIIDRDTWQRAQRIGQGKGAPKRGRQGHERKTHLLTDHLLECGRCGAAMRTRNHGEGRHNYECDHRIEFGTCDMPHLETRDVNTSLLPTGVASWRAIWTPSARSCREQADRKLAERRALRQAAEKALADAQRGIERLDDQMLDGAIATERYDRLVKRAEAQLATAERELADAVAREGEWTADTNLDDRAIERVQHLRDVIPIGLRTPPRWTKSGQHWDRSTATLSSCRRMARTASPR